MHPDVCRRRPRAADHQHRVILALALLSTLPFALFAYNSGFGYDALEYLIIGRSLHDGYSLYDIVPSKSPGIYLFVDALIGLGIDFGHVQLAATISTIYAATILCTFLAVKPHAGTRAAVLASVLTGMCAWFMEINFLQPTGFVYLFGLGGYVQCLRALEPGGRARNWFWCGFWIAIAIQFKSVAAFYGVGALGALLLWSERNRLPSMVALASGALVPTIAIALYFAVTGRGADYLQWTFFFPLFEYPANTAFLAKLYTKLLFFFVLFVASTLGSLLPAARRELWRSNPIRVAWLFGALSLFALLKTQASHYFYPAATFLSIATASGLSLVLKRSSEGRRWQLFVSGAVGVSLFAASTALYRPDAVARLVQLRDFGEEVALRDYVVRHVAPSERLIALQASTTVYWLAHRYPNLPLIGMDVQSTRYLELHPGLLAEAIRDARVDCVELTPGNLGLQDVRMLDSPAARAQIETLQREVERDFVKRADSPAGFTFWCRR